jgi:Domain of unknown function (DUF4168)
MSMLTVNYSFDRPNPRIIKGLLIILLSTFGVVSGFVPEIKPEIKPQFGELSFSLNFSTIARAQNFTQQEVVNFARAGFYVEMLRQKVYREIKEIINQPPPNIACNQPETINSLSSNIRGIVDDYCKQSTQIILDNNLTIARYNQLKKLYDREGEFYQQVQSVLIQMQKK